MNGKVQMFLWLGFEEQQDKIFHLLPEGFSMPKLPLKEDTHAIRYTGENIGLFQRLISIVFLR